MSIRLIFQNQHFGDETMYKKMNGSNLTIATIVLFTLFSLGGSAALLSQTQPTWQPISGNEHNMIAMGNVYLNNVLVSGSDYWMGTYGPDGVFSDCRSANLVAANGAYYTTIRGNTNGQAIKFVLLNTRTLRSFVTTESLTFLNDDLQATCNLHFSGEGSNLSITSPNGGEVWRRGESRNITWTATNVPGYLTIELLHNGELAGTIVSSFPVTDGRLPWIVGRLFNGTFVTGGNLKIRIRSQAIPVMANTDLTKTDPAGKTH